MVGRKGCTIVAEFSSIGVTKPVCLWRENTNRLVSLWDIVKQIAAHNLVQSGRNLQALAMAAGVGAPQRSLNSEDVKVFLAHFGQMQRDCDSLGFVVTGDLLKWVMQEFSVKTHTYDQAQATIENVGVIYQQELSREFFAYIESDKQSTSARSRNQ
jgi:hypothetical protein